MAIGLRFGNGGGGGISPTPSTIVPLVPTMTSNTTPSGIANASSIWSSQYDAWNAFTDSVTLPWSSANAQITNQYLRYTFTDGMKVFTNIALQNPSVATKCARNFKVQVLNSSAQWVDVPGASFTNNSEDTTNTYSLPTAVTGYGLGIYILDNYGHSAEINVPRLQFYGYKVSIQPFYIYKNGVFNIGMDNPGEYYTSGGTNVGVTLDTAKFTCTATGSGYNYSVIGSSQPFNFSGYSTLIVRCKGLTQHSPYGYGDVNVQSTKQTGTAGNQLSSTQINSNIEHSVSIDVTNLASAYITFAANGNKSIEFYEAYLI